MAGTLTHAYFSLDLYDKLSIRSKELLMHNKEDLKMFSQNTDPLFLYKIATPWKQKKLRKFAYFSQSNKSLEFFTTLINYIKYNDYLYNPQVMAYLYGMLSHYVLDSSIHPYIIYKTGYLKKDDSSTYKYNMLHEELETYIDNYLVVMKEKIKPHKFKCHKFCFNVDRFDKGLVDVIDWTYKEVYGIENFSKYYLDSCKYMKKFYKRFRYDPIGIKKIFYFLVDKITPKKTLRTVPLSYKVRRMKDKLNLDHQVWYNPTDKRNKYNTSVLEIYTSALDKTVSMINDINQYMYYDKKINLNKVIGNLSYVTGKDCDNKKELKYFEF